MMGAEKMNAMQKVPSKVLIGYILVPCHAYHKKCYSYKCLSFNVKKKKRKEKKVQYRNIDTS